MENVLFIYVGQTDYGYAMANKRDYAFKREPQIGLAYLAAVLEEQGVHCEILDMTIENTSIDQIKERVANEKPLFVGIYAANAIKNSILDLTRSLSHEGLRPVYIGGPDYLDADDYLKAGADAFCMGEGERTILELTEHARGRVKLADVKGISYIKEGKIVETPKQPLIENLDDLPVPAWDKFDLTRYYDFHVFDMDIPYTSIMGSRGCPWRCSFCTSPDVWQKEVRKRSPEHILKEVDYLVRERGIRYLSFQDDIWFWKDFEGAKRFCKLLKERKYDLKWRAILHPMSFNREAEEMLPLMYEAGCTSVTTGLQSASPKVLRNIQRSTKEPESLAKLIRIMNKLGISNNTAFIFGLPGETTETMEECIQYALRVLPTFVAFYSLAVLPGTAIHTMQQAGEFESMPKDVLMAKCREGAKRFYSSPKVLFNMMRAVIRRNPMWVFKAMTRLTYLTQLAGLQTKTLEN